MANRYDTRRVEMVHVIYAIFRRTANEDTEQGRYLPVEIEYQRIGVERVWRGNVASLGLGMTLFHEGIDHEQSKYTLMVHGRCEEMPSPDETS